MQQQQLGFVCSDKSNYAVKLNKSICCSKTDVQQL